MIMDEGHEPLPESRCWELLRSGGHGRVGVTIRALPVIVSVRYAVVGSTIAFPAEPHTTLASATAGHVLAFQADARDDQGGWSVHAIGRGDLVRDPDERFAPLAEALATAGRSADGWIVGIEPVVLSGSAIGVLPPPTR